MAKLETLYTIYDLVKDTPLPTMAMLPTSALILRHTCAWDEVVQNLTELQSEGLVTMNQRSTALISITDKGIKHIRHHIACYK